MNIRNLLAVSILASILTVSYARNLDVTGPSSTTDSESYKYLKKHMGEDSLLVRECENKNLLERRFEGSPFEELVKSKKTKLCDALDLGLSPFILASSTQEELDDLAIDLAAKGTLTYVLQKHDSATRIAEMKKYYGKLRKQQTQ